MIGMLEVAKGEVLQTLFLFSHHLRSVHSRSIFCGAWYCRPEQEVKHMCTQHHHWNSKDLLSVHSIVCDCSAVSSCP